MCRKITITVVLLTLCGCQSWGWRNETAQVDEPEKPRVTYPNVPRTAFTGPGALTQGRF
jgi:hypothetical protein